MYANYIRMSVFGLVLSGCGGCKNDKDPIDTGLPGDDTAVGIDDDADGYSADEDCNDNDDAVNPGATEICDGLDNNCDGSIDEDGAQGGTSWYTDADGDGYGDDGTLTEGCEPPSGSVAVGGDCDDTDAAYNPSADESCDESIDYNCDGSTGYTDADADGVPACEDCDDASAASFPGADELCDDADNDCDGSIDEDALDASSWYTDADSDTYGDDGLVTASCDQPDGSVAVGGDCDDADPAYNPGATEACDEDIDYNCDGSTGYADEDGDGVPACEDCDDAAPGTYPGATELCDAADNDCDGEIDEDAADVSTWYTDADSDTYGDDGTLVESCTAPTGGVAVGGDCDDADPAYNPGATEACDEDIDYNCDGSTGYTDADGDGVAACEDCDDGAAGTYPGASEVCDESDNDCDGEIDEDATDGATWYADTDADGYGDAAVTTQSCTAPEGYVSDALDCDDGSGDVHPYADELCNDADDDCDGEIDEADAVDGATWYSDGDGDGYGADGTTTTACEMPDGYSAYGGDCDDGDTAYNPGADESDCTDPNDYNCDGFTGYADGDADGFAACEECDDDDSAINPAAVEVCDGVDNDCDTTVDGSDAVDQDTWYADSDTDGYGDAGSTADDCDMPAGYVDDDTDCDDTDADISPEDTELCDGLDNDCDGEIDEDDAFGTTTWYADTDGDGFGDPSSTVEACTPPAGYVADDTDCNDRSSGVNPDAAEVCDGVDNDCSGVIDGSDATDAKTWYYDSDNDAYGDPAVTTEACTRPTGYRARARDCDDGDSAINPAATEICDGVDNDCDTLIDETGATGGDTWYADTDSDGYGDPDSSTEACTAPTGYLADSSDCDDGDADINPDGAEVCDGEDNNCDGAIDEAGATGGDTWYADDDDDGFGDASDTTESCTAPTGYTDDDNDCDDTDAAVNPDATESCDEIDNDCDGRIDESGATGESTWYADDDEDGYGDKSDKTKACDKPTGYVSDNTDCDDTDSDEYPGALEVCDGDDDDCDDEIDEAGAYGETTWYADADEDDYGDPDDSVDACDAPAGYVAAGTDCNDEDDTIFPTAYDYCNGIDDDCDGTEDEGEIEGKVLLSVDTDIGYSYAIDPTDASITEVAPVGTSIKVNSVAVGPDGAGYVERSGILYSFDACTGTFTAIGATGQGQTCGLSFDADGELWGLDGRNDRLIKIDPDTGAGTVVGSLGFSMGTCGLAYDCRNDRLIGAEGTNDYVFEIDRLTGTASDFYASGANFDSTGIEYDPTTQMQYGATGTQLYEIDIDAGTTSLIGTFTKGTNLDDLVYYPECE